MPGDAAVATEDWALHYGAIALGVILGLALVGVGLVRATGHKVPNPVTEIQQAAGPAVATAAVV